MPGVVSMVPWGEGKAVITIDNQYYPSVEAVPLSPDCINLIASGGADYIQGQVVVPPDRSFCQPRNESTGASPGDSSNVLPRYQSPDSEWCAEQAAEDLADKAGFFDSSVLTPHPRPQTPNPPPP